MSENETGEERGSEMPFARAYDYFKHLTGISLLSVGGVFAFLDGGEITLDPRRAAIVLACLGLAGATSLLMAGNLAALEVKPAEPAKKAKQVRYSLVASTFFLASGLGAFIQTFTSAMFK
ncbi:MAG: hypothetical protein CVT77_18575 [Alphaproteobacteria bacterium HGW-Alphaproteobacteria-16]|nr:MAG: hypothetical protein CVT77_18575 [Alphaproteobacteria bacterium HGW-Alphaproteobacteria-16]